MPTDKTEQVRIRCREETKKEWGRVCADLDPDATYEEVLTVMIEVYRDSPKRFARQYQYGR